MGKVGRSYPRFIVAAGVSAEAAQGEGSIDFQVRLGAVIGIACALGLIAWLVMR